MTDDLDDPRPMHQRVADGLREAIERGEYAVGDKLPSYAQLGEQYGVSHMTVKQAISALKRDQIVTGRQGMGVFVRQVVRREKDVRTEVDELRARVESLEVRIHDIETRGATQGKP